MYRCAVAFRVLKFKVKVWCLLGLGFNFRVRVWWLLGLKFNFRIKVCLGFGRLGF